VVRGARFTRWCNFFRGARERQAQNGSGTSDSAVSGTWHDHCFLIHDAATSDACAWIDKRVFSNQEEITMNTQVKLAAVLLSALFIFGCDEGPMEEAGENIDNAATDLGNAVEDACEDVKEGAGAEDKDC
jgi:hypothetical protein